MRFYKCFLLILSVGLFLACGESRKPETPLETLKIYTQAIKKKDAAQMKRLLSEASVRMFEQEAKAQNLPLDEIVRRDPIFNENQKTVEFRNEKINGERATIELKNSFGMWNTIFFVRENGIWKIDKQGFANQIFQQAEEGGKSLDDVINQGRIP